MRKLAFAAGAAALLSLAAITLPAQAHQGGFYPPPPHRGYIVTPSYVPPAPHWRGHNERRWDDRRGRWDRDHDGVPNRYDRDRDGDGVPNRFDRRPDNRYRY
jgi:hypothetical protein